MVGSQKNMINSLLTSDELLRFLNTIRKIIFIVRDIYEQTVIKDNFTITLKDLLYLKYSSLIEYLNVRNHIYLLYDEYILETEVKFLKKYEILSLNFKRQNGKELIDFLSYVLDKSDELFLTRQDIRAGNISFCSCDKKAYPLTIVPDQAGIEYYCSKCGHKTGLLNNFQILKLKLAIKQGKI